MNADTKMWLTEHKHRTNSGESPRKLALLKLYLSSLSYNKAILFQMKLPPVIKN